MLTSSQPEPVERIEAQPAGVRVRRIEQRQRCGPAGVRRRQITDAVLGETEQRCRAGAEPGAALARRRSPDRAPRGARITLQSPAKKRSAASSSSSAPASAASLVTHATRSVCSSSTRAASPPALGVVISAMVPMSLTRAETSSAGSAARIATRPLGSPPGAPRFRARMRAGQELQAPAVVGGSAAAAGRPGHERRSTERSRRPPRRRPAGRRPPLIARRRSLDVVRAGERAGPRWRAPPRHGRVLPPATPTPPRRRRRGGRSDGGSETSTASRSRHEPDGDRPVQRREGSGMIDAGDRSAMSGVNGSPATAAPAARVASAPDLGQLPGQGGPHRRRTSTSSWSASRLPLRSGRPARSARARCSR